MGILLYILESDPVGNECRHTLLSAQYVKRWINKRYSGVRGNLSLAVHSFRYKPSDGTIQEDDLSKDLVMDGETYEFPSVYAISDSQGSTLDMKVRVYASCVRSSMIYRNETMLLLADVGLMFERADMQMIRWMCGVSMKDRKTSEKIMNTGCTTVWRSELKADMAY